MKTLRNETLAPYTSLRVGGPAENLILAETYEEIVEILRSTEGQIWFLGFGCNVLVSDTGLSGTTVIWRGGEIRFEDDLLVADAGVWWDNVVKASIEHDLWGLELLSEIPSSVGGAVFGNIAAYGQQVSDSLVWLEIYDKATREIKRLGKEDLGFSYRHSTLQENDNIVILRAAFKLSKTPMHELKYDSALAIGNELGLDHRTLAHCREIIIETRRRAGSIYHPDDPNPEQTAGSFFKNPMVTLEQAKELARFDETGKTLERILNQSIVHGGNVGRASAAHVLLAAGFKRGQDWGRVLLHPSHILKIATLRGATATEVYNVVQEIVSTVKEKLDITLEPEVKFLGKF